MTNILLVGESWVSSSNHFKGFDQFGSVTFHTGAKRFVSGMETLGHTVTYMQAHDAAEQFPINLEGLANYDVIILSDIGANTLLLHPDVWLRGERAPNRLALIEEWTRQGGGLVMIGGYFSFQGIDGRARWRNTPVETTLPVRCLPHDDRLEIPEGAVPVVADPNHPIVRGMPNDWPYLLGVNEVEVKSHDGVQSVLSLPETQRGLPLLVTGQHGNGRSVAWMSDMSEHWLPPTFLAWDGYDRLFGNIISWAAKEI
ncbi:MAG: glutamine amidotransferase [Tateyamaria sp.]|jgi:uncharacterized membrane protein|nr:glutamine amidotransferase [Tateyamaria sp.]MDG1421727.1 glutamine amidotransferase [Tateyamaria sp.]